MRTTETRVQGGVAAGASLGAVLGAGLGWLVGIGLLGSSALSPIVTGPIVGFISGLGLGSTLGGIADALLSACMACTRKGHPSRG
jgi:hypothetical protein